MFTYFIPKYMHIGKVGGVESADAIESEPMLYGASWEWAIENAGPITQEIMDKIQHDVMLDCEEQSMMGYHPVIDTKSVQLMPGMYPCIPGWHCDGVIRKDRSSQPDLSTLTQPVAHYICVISDNPNAEGTEILTTKASVRVDESDVWTSVDKSVRNTRGRVTYTTKLGEIIRFTRSTLHNGTPAKERCWRYFFRLSFYHMPVQNRIRNQVQVYTDFKKGW